MVLTPRQWIAIDRLLSLAAVALSLGASWKTLSTGSPAALEWGFASLAALFPLLASLGGIRGSAIGFSLLWGAVGLTTGLGLLTIFDVGVFYLGAALILAFVIAYAPNWTTSSRIALPYLVVEVVGFVAVLAPLLVM